MKVDLKEIQKYIDQKLISVQKHPEADLFIYNYTPKAQFDKIWNEYTMMCRGLILDKEGNIIARPFKKFFNLEEQKEVPAEDFEVFEKWDGSLGILYWLNNKPYIATRGSFISDQSVEGTKMIQELFVKSPYLFLREYTYLFEIIYPENRIVVDYKGMRGLVLLTIIETETGKEFPYEEILEAKGIMNLVKRFDGVKDIGKIKGIMPADNKEGFVIRFKSGLRVKIKFDEYVRLHRLVTQINARHIWELLKEGKSVEELLDHVPDEFYMWVKTTVADLKGRFEGIELYSKQVFEFTKKYETRKEKAECVLRSTKAPSVVFAMIDNKNYAPIIWKMIKPKHEVPFKKEI